jgi:hypothetical protein
VADLKADEKVCPFCAEVIKAAAVKCRFCQSDLTGAPVGDQAPDAPAVPPHDTVVASVAPEGEVPPPPPLDEPVAGPARGPVPFLAGFKLLCALLALCLVLVAVTGYAWYRSENPSEGKAPDGVITSSQARDAGMQAAATLTQKVLSYDWKTLPADMKASEAVLAPSFRSQYAKTMDGVKDQTVKNQVKLTAAVVATSIISASTRKVQALVFVNQITTAKGSANQRLDQNRVRVTLTRDGGDWRVSKMDAF